LKRLNQTESAFSHFFIIGVNALEESPFLDFYRFILLSNVKIKRRRKSKLRFVAFQIHSFYHQVTGNSEMPSKKQYGSFSILLLY
jgi:hypothetical protein